MARGIITQLGVGDFAHLLSITMPHHQAYARRHGLDYMARSELLLPECHPSWSKIPLVLGLLKEGRSPVVWMDADTVVRDPTRNVATACDGGIGCVWYETPFPHFNAGVFVAWPEPAVIAFLEFVLRFASIPCRGMPGGEFWEQPYLNFLDPQCRVLRSIGQEWNTAEGFCSHPDPVIVGSHGMAMLKRFEIALNFANE